MRERTEDIGPNETAIAPATTNGNGGLTFSNPHASLKSRSQHQKALVALALVCFFWGTTWIASKEGVRHMPALQLVGIRLTIGGLCYVLFFTLRGATWPRGREWRVILILGFLNFVLSNALSTWGVKYISAGLGSIITAIVPLWLVLINRIGARATLPRAAVIGLLHGFAGVCVIFYEHLSDFINPQFRFGILLSFAATWSWALGTLFTKKHVTGFNPYFSLGLRMLISGICVWIANAVIGVTIPLSQIPWQSWASIGYLVVFGSIISFAAFLYSLRHLPIEQSGIYAYINPIVAVLFGWLLFSESLTIFIIAGMLLTLYGVYLVNKAAIKR